MKLGFHCFLFTDRWSDESLWILDKAVQMGFGCVEVCVGDDVSFRPNRLRRRVEQLGLDLVFSPGGVWPEVYDLSADEPAERKRGLAWHCNHVSLAAECGAVAYTGALYGHPGTVKRRIPPADEYARTAEELHNLAEWGLERGIQIVLEPMSHFRTHLVNTPAQALDLIALAAHRNLSILFDTYHMVTEVRDYAAVLRDIGPKLWGLHTCENDRGVPGGGLVPWDVVFATLAEIRFDGYAILEAYNSSIGDFAFRRGMFHNVCPDGEAFARQGVEFIREKTI